MLATAIPVLWDRQGRGERKKKNPYLQKPRKNKCRRAANGRVPKRKQLRKLRSEKRGRAATRGRKTGRKDVDTNGKYRLTISLQKNKREERGVHRRGKGGGGVRHLSGSSILESAKMSAVERLIAGIGGSASKRSSKAVIPQGRGKEGEDQEKKKRGRIFFEGFGGGGSAKN